MAIVYDGSTWHVRREVLQLRMILHATKMVYRCDQPIGGDQATRADAVRSAVAYREQRTGGARDGLFRLSGVGRPVMPVEMNTVTA
jgi:hypothetical protein